jgi:hypothetical protein
MQSKITARARRITNLILLIAVILIFFVAATFSVAQTGDGAAPQTGNPAGSAQSSGGSNSDSQTMLPSSENSTQSKPALLEGPDHELHLRPEGGLDPATKLPLYKTIIENWSDLAIGKSKLTPELPVEAGTEDLGTFTRTLVQVKWRPGDPIDLYVILPKDVSHPPAVLYLYGHDEDTFRFKDDHWAARVTGGGVAAIGFVSAMTGQRFHDRPLKQWFVSELQESLGSTVHDVKFILDYLASRGDVDMSRIGMFGQGSGATIAILAAAADARIKVIDLLDPWGDWPVWLAKSSVVQDDPNKADYLKPQFLKKVAPLDPVKWLPLMKSVHIRLQQPMDADPVPRLCKDRIKSALPKTKEAEVLRFKTTAELFNSQGGGNLFQWIKAQVKGLPGAPDSLPTIKTAASANGSSRSGVNNGASQPQ